MNNLAMIEFQLRARGIEDERILNAFEHIPRENFVLYKKHAYDDSAQPIGYGQTISQPYVVALMTELLEPNKDDIVLEIGTGSGYQAAILSKLVNRVVSVEIVVELVDYAKKNLAQLGINNVEVKHSDAGLDLDEKFDKIIVTAATDKLIWGELLKEGGILVLPKGEIYSQVLTKYKKINEVLVLVEKSIPVIFVPLTGKNSF